MLQLQSLDALYRYALSFYGMPYEYGGDGIRGYGIDCSGLIQRILAPVGLDPAGDQTAHSLYLHFNSCPKAQKRGSLAFFGNRDRISHVGWMIDELSMISAAGGGINCSTLAISKALHANVKLQPVSWYHVPAFVGAFDIPYQFG